MKKTDIVADGTYSNGKGRTRKVLELGSFPIYAMQSDHDCVKYQYRNAAGAVKTSSMTRGSFAKWAQKRVD